MSTHPTPTPDVVPPRLSDYALLALVGFIFFQIMHILKPFTGALVTAVVIGVSFYPLHLRLTRSLHKPALTAGLTTLLVLLFLIVPAVTLVMTLIKEAQALGPTLKEWMGTFEDLKEGRADSIGALRSLRRWLYATLGIEPAVFRQQIGSVVSGAASTVSDMGAELAKGSMTFLLHLAVMLITLFFIFLEGRQMLQMIHSHLPLPVGLQARLQENLHHSIIGIVRGMFMTSLAQGIAATVGYLIVGAPAVVLLGFLTAVAALVPTFGTAFVTVPLALFYLFEHEYFKGIFMLAWGALIVGILDNLLRPYLVGTRVHIPFLPLFLSLLGGLEIWGAKGIVIGPVIFAIAPVLLSEYRQRYVAGGPADVAKWSKR